MADQKKQKEKFEYQNSEYELLNREYFQTKTEELEVFKKILYDSIKL